MLILSIGIKKFFQALINSNFNNYTPVKFPKNVQYTVMGGATHILHAFKFQ